jgi:ketosteroid isomerase-like protein
MAQQERRFDRRRLLEVGGAGVAGAALTGTQPASARERGVREENLQIVQGYYRAYAANDPAALRDRYFAPDITWTIPGHHPLAGTKRGLDEVLAFFEQLGRAGFRATTLFLEANGEWVVDLHRGWSTRGRPRIDITWALAFRIRDGRIAEAVNYPGDQHEADRFFWARYPLAPLPDRLAPE